MKMVENNKKSDEMLIVAREQQIYKHGCSKVLTLPKKVYELLGERCFLVARRVGDAIVISLVPTIKSKKIEEVSTP